MNKLGVFIKDTFWKNVKSVSFITMLLSPIILIVIIAGIGYFVAQSESDIPEVELAVISKDSSVVPMLEESDGNLTVKQEITTEEEAQAALEQDQISGYLMVDVDGDQLKGSLVHEDLNNHIPIIEQVLTNAQILLRANELNLTPEQLGSLNEPAVLDTQVVSIDDGEIVEEDDLEQGIQIGSAYVINIVILMFIMFYASTVIEEVAGEKGTRMMEVILSSTTATTHFFGKLIGVFLVMLVHILFYIIVGTAAFMYFRNHELVVSLIGDLDIGAILVQFLEFSSIFLIIGVIMFMFIAAFLGSLITKTEDINKAATPLSLIVVLGFYIGLFAMAQPENIVVVISSFVPLMTPFVMPFRIATDTVSSLHVWLSLGGAALFTGLLAYISLIFYRANVLIYSDTNFINTLKQSWALVRSEN
ncbi:MAG TPA: ABC transporter permease [Candidatus Atopostipes pullistercoris]|uniref:ABC transporter permease n=1 Tax=Candidatus Atopostipes pullistercoris TaxID=2838467 RepID=A0A9D2JXM5_9LACT|nr:ABC transporter permease [Candidatus Atopostipes pullistercoris]